MILPVILAGGSGTRLWPLSRALFPKQLIDLVDERTLLQNTVGRLAGMADAVAPVVICNAEYRFMIAEQLRAIDMPARSIVLEPVGKNTAPAVAVAAIRALAEGQDPILLVLPADHFIGDTARFHQVLAAGADLAEAGHLITFGIVPDAPETGYGYIRKGQPVPGYGPGDAAGIEAVAIDRFVEKPDRDTAEAYLASGDYCWNSGMFMFKASSVLTELSRWAPEMVAACTRAIDRGRADLDFFRLDPEAFAECPADSIDYAVMEKTRAGVMLLFSAGWNDVGSWEALWQIGGKNGDGNILRGDVRIHDVRDCYIHGTSRLVAAVGIAGHVLIETADAVLVAPRDRVQEIKAIVERLKADQRPEVETHRQAYRPWGSIEDLVSDAHFRVNRLHIRPGQKIDLQRHRHRAEHWVVVQGTAWVIRGNKTLQLSPDESTFIPPGTIHRVENRGEKPLEIVEIQTGPRIDEADIERLETAYR